MAIIFLVAVDVGFFREFWKSSGSEIEVAVVTFPMANVLLLMLLRLRSVVGSRPFRIVFQTAGWIVVVIFGVLAGLVPHWFFQPMETFMDATGMRRGEPLSVFVAVTVAIIGYMTPQLLIAFVAARLSSRYREVIERR